MDSHPRTRAIALAVTALLLAAVAAAYAPAARRDGDAGLADAALEGLGFVGQVASMRGPASLDYSNALEDNAFTIDLLLYSDSRERLPEVAAAVEDARLAYLVADQLWRLQEAGESTPLVSEVHAGDTLLAAYPELAEHVTGTGPQVRFENTDLAAVDAIFRLAAARRTEAAAALAAARAER